MENIDASAWYPGLEPKQVAFLEAYSRCGSVIQSAQGVCHRDTHYDWLERSDIYRAAFRKAQLLFGDLLQQEAIYRAVQGREEQVFRQGKPSLDEEGKPVLRRRTDRILLKHLMRTFNPDPTQFDIPYPTDFYAPNPPLPR